MTRGRPSGGRGQDERGGTTREAHADGGRPSGDRGRDEHPPRLVYDDDCGFCTWCVERALNFGEFEPVGFSELTPDQRARLPDDYERSAHLLTDATVYSAGEAVEQAFVRMVPQLDGVVAELREFETYREIREGLYRWGADRRDWWGKVLSACPPATRDRTE